MRDFPTLRFLDLFQALFTKFGVNYPVMRRILQAKFIMDQRRVPTIFSQSAKKKGKDQNYFIKSLWIYVLFGLLMIPFMVLGNNYIFQISIVFGILMFLVMTSMISDFSSVLLDVRDKQVLTTKPIERKTISMAKTIHVCIYLFFLSGAMILPSLIAGLIKHGIMFTFIFLVEIILIDMLIVVMTAMIYFLILKFFDGEKLKDIINYVQIGLSIMIAVGYQFVARSFDILNIDIVFVPSWWQLFIPPIWYGAPFELLLNHNQSGFIIVLSLLALFVPLLSIGIYMKIMPAFEKYLQKLSNHSGNDARPKEKWKLWVMDILCTSKEEKVFYRFADHMMKNEREFRLKVYPSLGFSLVIPFIFIGNQLAFTSFEDILESNWYLSIYFTTIVIPTAVMMIRYSGKYKGAWIYKTVPIHDLGTLFSGTIKAFLVKLYFPVLLLISIIFVLAFGIRIVPDLVIVFLGSLVFAFICAKSLLTSYPFSESFEDAQKDAGIRVLPFMLLIGVFYGIHLASLLVSWGPWVYMAILLLVNIFIWRNPYKKGQTLQRKEEKLSI